MLSYEINKKIKKKWLKKIIKRMRIKFDIINNW